MYKMSLLANVNQPSTGQYYFALDSTPVDPVVTAPRFEAIGDATNGGTFTAKSDDTTGAGEGVFQIQSKISGNAQWSIGLDGIPAGANSGNNLAIFAYGDAGDFLSAPLTINRATGDVETTDALTVGSGGAVGGSLLQVNGTLGLSRVYDPIYNPIVPGAEVLLSQFGPDGSPSGPLVPYTPTKSGLYTLTMEITADTNGLGWTNGVSLIVGFLANQAPPFAIISDSFVACDSLANPALFLMPSGFPTGVYPKDIVAVINLTAGTTYVPTIQINNGGMNLGATGGVRFFIQPLIA